MSHWIITTSLLTLSIAVAQNIGSKREIFQHNHGDSKIVLTSKGQASLAQKASAEINPWELQKAAFDHVEEQTRATNATSTNAESFAQNVNGSTPTGWMQVGTPPKWLLVIFDTGSDKLVAKTWDTLKNELASVDQGIDGMVLPSDAIYNHDTSTSYVRRMAKDPTTNETGPAQSEIAYGSGVAVTDEGNDTVKIGPFLLNNFSLSEITQDSLELLHTKKGISGVFGLQHMKNASLGRSFFSRMRDEGKFSSFGYCRGAGNNGTFIWGDHSTEGAPIDVIGQMHWAVALGPIQMNGRGADHNNVTQHNNGTSHHEAGDGDKIVVRTTDKDFIKRRSWSWPFNAPADDGSDSSGDNAEEDLLSNDTADGNKTKPVPCADRKCVGILDTGSNIIAGPTDFMKAISEKANVAQDCSNYESLPTIAIEFGGQNLTIHKEGYVMKVPMPDWAKLGHHLLHADADGGDDGEAGSDGAGLEEQGVKRQKSKLGWPAVFEHLRKNRGIDLSAAMRGMMDFENATDDGPPHLCMPALVPLDKKTSFGPLFIVGTPLLQTYYARWSWKEGDAAPKIFIKDLPNATTCTTAAADGHAHGPLVNSSKLTEESESFEQVSTPLLRSQKAPAQTGILRSKGPTIREIEDISFPHWALHVNEDL